MKTITNRRPKYGKEEFARRRDVIYDRDVAPHVTPGQKDQFVAIDVESGDFEIDPDERTASNRLLVRQPDAQIWLRRVGLHIGLVSILRGLKSSVRDGLQLTWSAVS